MATKTKTRTLTIAQQRARRESTQFILARTSKGRPTLMHALGEHYGDKTVCGLEVTNWSRAYKAEPIKEILCVKCGKSVGAS